LHVTLIPRDTRGDLSRCVELDARAGETSADEAHFTTTAHAEHRLACSAGDIDVCGVPGCRDEDHARDCLAPKILDYVKTITNMCVIRQRSEQMFRFQQPERVNSGAFARPICSGLKQDNGFFVMKVAHDDALLAIISYASEHAALPLHDVKNRQRGVILARLQHGGIGNLFQTLFTASLMAVIDGRRLLVSLDGKSQQRYEGHFTCAADVFVGGSAGVVMKELKNSRWHVNPTFRTFHEELDYTRCSWGTSAQSSHDGTVTQISYGRDPVALLLNDRYNDDIRKTFGFDADFYLSHFTVVPVGETRQRVADAMAMIRSKYSVVIGIHMRWIAQGI
jgi:hypothetical protein